MLEALDGQRVTGLISPALTGPKLNAAGLARFEKAAAGRLCPRKRRRRTRRFPAASCLRELNARERTEVVRAFEMTEAERPRWKSSRRRREKLEAALKSPRIRRPSRVSGEHLRASSRRSPNGPLRVADRRRTGPNRTFYDEVSAGGAGDYRADQVAATGVKPGTPKFEKAYRPDHGPTERASRKAGRAGTGADAPWEDRAPRSCARGGGRSCDSSFG